MGHREDDMPAIVHRPTRLWHPDYGRGALAAVSLVATFELVSWIIRATVASAPGTMGVLACRFAGNQDRVCGVTS
jgi:hypothetical protein